MKRKLTSSVVLCAVLCAGTLAATATVKTLSGQDKNQAKLAKQAKITMEQARKIALERAPGTIEEEELEKEHGKLVYSFDIRNAQGTITEVQVDAKDGTIASVEEEDAKKEAEEKRKEEKKKGNGNNRP